MEDRKVTRAADPEFARKLEAIQEKMLKAQKLLESAEANFEEAEMHYQRASDLRRAINS